MEDAAANPRGPFLVEALPMTCSSTVKDEPTTFAPGTAGVAQRLDLSRSVPQLSIAKLRRATTCDGYVT
jgi:hypothetical protein